MAYGNHILQPFRSHSDCRMLYSRQFSADRLLHGGKRRQVGSIVRNADIPQHLPPDPEAHQRTEEIPVGQRIRELRRSRGDLQVTEHIVRDLFQICGQKKDDPAFGVVKTAGGDHSDPAGRKTHCAQNRLLIRIQEHRVGRNIPLNAGVPKLCDPLPEERLFLIRHYWRMFSPEIFTVPVLMEALTVEVRISWNSPDRLTLSGVMIKI